MKNATYIALVVDRSGSIRSVLEQMQSACDEFIKAQKEAEGECSLLLADFDTQYREIYHGPIAKAPKYTIEPLGGTALHDAVGRTINSLGIELAAMPESERPDKIMVVIITDGEENSSREFSGDQVRQMVQHQTEKYGWNFDYLGANQDAILVGASMGILAENSLTFCASNAGLSNVTHSLSSKAMMFRSSGVYTSYSPEDRTAAMEEDDSKS